MAERTTITVTWDGDPARLDAALALVDEALVEHGCRPGEPQLLARAIAVRARGLRHIDAHGLTVEVRRG